MSGDVSSKKRLIAITQANVTHHHLYLVPVAESLKFEISHFAASPCNCRLPQPSILAVHFPYIWSNRSFLDALIPRPSKNSIFSPVSFYSRVSKTRL